jgi:hypothetical protein
MIGWKDISPYIKEKYEQLQHDRLARISSQNVS